jgi:hypothetical protein
MDSAAMMWLLAASSMGADCFENVCQPRKAVRYVAMLAAPRNAFYSCLASADAASNATVTAAVGQPVYCSAAAYYLACHLLSLND